METHVGNFHQEITASFDVKKMYVMSILNTAWNNQDCFLFLTFLVVGA